MIDEGQDKKMGRSSTLKKTGRGIFNFVEIVMWNTEIIPIWNDKIQTGITGETNIALRSK